MMVTRLCAKCKTWRCKAEISLGGTPGFYFRGEDLKYEGSSFRATCKACGKSHRYTLRNGIVYRGGEAVR